MHEVPSFSRLVNQAGIEFYERTDLPEHIQDKGYLTHSSLGHVNSEKKKLLIGTGARALKKGARKKNRGQPHARIDTISQGR